MPEQPSSTNLRFARNSLATGSAVLLIVLAAAAAYSNSFQGQFVFDDDESIPGNPSIRSLWPIWPVLTSAQHATVVGRPLLNLSLALNYAWGGTHVGGYHAVNLALHVLAAVVLFGVVRRTLALPQMPIHVARYATGLAFAVALLWTVHPLQTESVTYIVQRAESLVAIFYLFTLYCVIRGTDDSDARVWWYVAAVLSCWGGMACKEVMVSAPLIVLIYDRVFFDHSLGDIFRRRWRLYAGLFAAWVFLGMLMVSSGGRSSTAGFGYGMSSWDYAMTQFGAIVIYLRLCFWPHPLILDYGSKVARSPAEIVPYAAIVLSLFLASLWAFRVRPWIGFLGISFFAILAPSSSIVPLVTQTIAEHRMYLPLACVATLVVVASWEAWRFLCFRLPAGSVWAGVFGRSVPLVLLIGVSLSLGYQTHRRNRLYHSVRSIWEDNARNCPENPGAYYTIALELIKAGDTAGAIDRCNTALRLDRNCFFAYLNRGIAYAALKNYRQALDDFDRVIELNPTHRNAYLDRASVFAQLGNFDRALLDLTRAIQLDSASSKAYNLRGFCHKQQGDLELALEDYSQAIRLDPSFADALNNRGVAYAELGLPNRAIVDLTRVIQLKPDFAAAYKNRAICFSDTKQFELAWGDVRMFEKLGGRPNPEFIKVLTDASPETP